MSWWPGLGRLGEVDMFTALSIAGISIFAYLVARKVDRAQGEDHRTYDRLSGEELRDRLLLHIRQDLRLIAFLLYGIVAKGERK